MRHGISSVVFVGGGPAGLAGAIAARLAGLDTVVLERRRPPLDKACGEGIAPDGVAVLEALGVRLPRGAGHPFEGVRFVDGNADAVALFHRRSGLGIPRQVLHGAMVARARALGVDLRWGCAFRALCEGGLLTDHGPVRARHVIAADGLASAVGGALGLAPPPRPRRFGLRRHYDVAPWSRLVEVHWADGCEIYVTPVGAAQVNVVALTGDPELRLDRALCRLPHLRDRLPEAGSRCDDLGAASIAWRPGRVVHGRVALLGDASGGVDAITGAGVSLALRQAIALAAALRAGDLALYEREHRRLMSWPARLSGGMLAINRRRRLRRWTLRGLQAAPGVFSGMLALGTRPPALPSFLTA